MGREQHGARRDVYFHSSGSPVLPTVGEQLKASSVFVHVVDDDEAVRESLGDLLRSMGYRTTLHASATGFLDAELPDTPACLLLDVRLPDANGLEVQEYLKQADVRLPVILMTGFGDIAMSVRGMKAGAVDFLTKPVRHQDLLDAVVVATQLDQCRRQEAGQISALRQRYETLTPRERQVVALIASGLTNKGVARKLSISEVTVKMHRGSAGKKLEARSVAALVRMTEALGILG